MAEPSGWAADLQNYERQRRVELNPGLFKGPTVGYVRGEISKRERSYNPLLGRFLDDSREQEQAQFEEKIKKNFLNFARDVQLRREAPFDLVTHERKFEAFGPDASAGLEPPVKKKVPFPDTAADYNIVSNLPFNEPWLIAMPRQWVGQFLSGECSSTRLLAQTPAAFHANLLGPTLQKLRL
ncbi:truC [Symbiodinium natans]|uniref:TruC protein n=1 Tax=Symbiodinium natans TaxID=878477 RepID=A0A812TR34_9DINO|nr:truC [Symbiodinium natans]